MNFWDQRFAEPGYKYGTEPNAFPVSYTHLTLPTSDLV